MPSTQWEQKCFIQYYTARGGGGCLKPEPPVTAGVCLPLKAVASIAALLLAMLHRI